MTTEAWTRRCEVCGRRYADDVVAWRCECGGVLSLDIIAPVGAATSAAGIWRFERSLPAAASGARVTLGEGMTPLVPVRTVSGDVRAKLEFVSPTGSFKDRGNAVVVTRLLRLGVTRVLEDSSGNAGASLAGYCAAAGVDCTVFVPSSASPAKLAQIRAYGARVELVPGPRPAATEAALAAAKDVYYANHAWDPFFFEGTKTAAFEIVEQLGGRAPARVILPVGQGTLLLGLAKGFRELVAARMIDTPPRLIAVQSELCAPLAEVIGRGRHDLPAIAPPAWTLAEGIATTRPVRWRAIVDAIRESRGDVVRVREERIAWALATLGRAGLFVEPTAATALLGLEAAGGDGTSVLMLTGSGLKASATVAELLDEGGRASVR